VCAAKDGCLEQRRHPETTATVRYDESESWIFKEECVILRREKEKRVFV